jgi:hypothetical protein
MGDLWQNSNFSRKSIMVEVTSSNMNMLKQRPRLKKLGLKFNYSVMSDMYDINIHLLIHTKVKL